MFENDLTHLARRARDGDGAALEQLRHGLYAHAPLVVRQALRSDDDSPLVRRIRAAARPSLAGTGSRTPTEDRERMIGVLADWLCERFLQRYRPECHRRRDLQETIRV